MNTESIWILLTIIAYLGIVLAIGIYYAKKNESASDFYLGGRGLGPLVTAMSAEASDMSSYLLMGLPGLAYLSGFADVGWTIIGLAVGTYLNWLFTARRLRRYTQVTNSFTLPQFFSNRFRDNNNILALISALIIIIFFVPYTASGFAACGKLFSSLFGMNYMTAMIISAIVIVGYTATGGFLAASTTDFIQSIIMTFAIVFIVIFATVSAGGIDAVFENAKALPGYLSLTNTYIQETNTSSTYGFLKIISTCAWGLGYFGMPHILLRFMAIKDESGLKLSRRVASVWAAIAMFVAVCIGISGRALTSNGLIQSLSGSDTETIIIRIADVMSNYGVFFTIMAGLVLAGILASTMSTADSQLLAASSSVSQNILQEVLHLKISPKTSMLIARITVVIIAVIGIVIAQDPNSSVFEIVSFAWAGFGASFGPLILCSLFWKRTNLQGAIAGMLAGGISVFVWKYGIATLGGAFAIYELLPAFIIGIIAIIVVSLLTKAPSKEIVEEFEAVRNIKL
ncbi:sodium/proline symporter [Clostridium sp. SM-530-WT-3G]|uniref:sodium/proline symporter n=1 Tax=Clostridium sp. SM-530-WT-3G TaxID=2725303 RepID=UPI00145EC7B5|nr:sodium/proline symporter [Clostridium sp. SM-530-WT-3G]NME83784.1 sodium/proline symporter [Clostridium sp. SM-530-WT-3G]